MLPAFSTGAEESGLRITPPQGREDAIGYLTDGNAETRLTLERQKSVLVEWDAGDAVSLLISWYDSAIEVLIEVLDEKGAVLSRKIYQNTPYRQHVDVTSGSAVRITPQKGTASIAELELFRAGDKLIYADTDVYEADLLIVCAGATEECRLLGGLLPLYAGERNIRTAVIYIRTDYGYVTNECFRSLRTLGFEDYPVFMKHDDQNAATEERVRMLWRNNLSNELWRVIAKVRPKVIVTLDPNDKTEPARTRAAAKIIREIVQSYTKRGNLELQKFYVLSGEGGTVLDWRVPLALFGGRTAFEVAQEALLAYESQRMYGYSVPGTSRFELVYTTVGEDTAGNDLMEHIDADTLISYAGPTPLPLPTPEPLPAVG